jgi:hypothetical protein
MDRVLRLGGATPPPTPPSHGENRSHGRNRTDGSDSSERGGGGVGGGAVAASVASLATCHGSDSERFRVRANAPRNGWGRAGADAGQASRARARILHTYPGARAAGRRRAMIEPSQPQAGSHGTVPGTGSPGLGSRRRRTPLCEVARAGPGLLRLTVRLTSVMVTVGKFTESLALPCHWQGCQPEVPVQWHSVTGKFRRPGVPNRDLRVTGGRRPVQCQ